MYQGKNVYDEVDGRDIDMSKVKIIPIRILLTVKHTPDGDVCKARAV
jgi:hypothetical protein